MALSSPEFSIRNSFVRSATTRHAPPHKHNVLPVEALVLSSNDFLKLVLHERQRSMITDAKVHLFVVYWKYHDTRIIITYVLTSTN
jgi:hypothetical protein